MQHDGVVDKLIGDAIMAVFGAPVPGSDDALNAVRTAIEMRARLETLNEGFRARGLPEIRTGIGVHSGSVVAGNMGHVDRMEYTVIGDTVNLASRLQRASEATPPGPACPCAPLRRRSSRGTARPRRRRLPRR